MTGFRGIFDWDDEKNAANIQKHKISFPTASYVFDDIHHLVETDDEHSFGEERLNVIGMVGEVIFVVVTERGSHIRIISARLADDEERSVYEAQFGFYRR